MSGNDDNKSEDAPGAPNEETPGPTRLSQGEFMKVVDSFIKVANMHNLSIPAGETSAAFLYAAARYHAHVGKNVVKIGSKDDFIRDSTDSFADSLSQHLSDPNL